MRSLVLAAEAGIPNRDLWYPTILGVLVVVAGVSLFCGSVYLLLATNLGARLGFLVAAAGLSGFMVLLSCLWLTTASPLNTLKGRVPTWKAVESIKGGDLSKSKIPAVARDHQGRRGHGSDRAVEREGVGRPGRRDPGGDAGLERRGRTANKFALYTSTTDYLVPKYYEIGGGNIFSQFKFHVSGQFPIVHFSLHKPHFAVVNICPIDQEALIVPFGEPPPTPKCDTTKPINSVVFERDLGSVRVPPFVALVTSSILFTLTLLEPPLAGAGPAGAGRRRAGRSGRQRRHRRRTHPREGLGASDDPHPRILDARRPHRHAGDARRARQRLHEWSARRRGW